MPPDLGEQGAPPLRFLPTLAIAADNDDDNHTLVIVDDNGDENHILVMGDRARRVPIVDTIDTVDVVHTVQTALHYFYRSMYAYKYC